MSNWEWYKELMKQARKEDHDVLYCLVAGARTFHDYKTLEATLDELFRGHDKAYIEIVHGGAKGTDSLADEYARKHDCMTTVFRPDWKAYGKAAGYRRNKEMHDYIAQYQNRLCVLFWDGKSKGTAHSIKFAKERNTPLEVVYYGGKDD